jgi:heat shock protein HslJ
MMDEDGVEGFYIVQLTKDSCSMRKLCVLFLVLALGALAGMPAAAQDSPNLVSFNGFSFSFPSSLAGSVNIVQYLADDPAAETPMGAQPAATEFSLNRSTGRITTMEFVPPSAVITVTRAADMVNYPEAQAQGAALLSLLSSRSDLTAADELPVLPLLNGFQAVRARAQYVDFPGFSGIAYVTSAKFDASPVLDNQLSFVFFGVSSDGSTFVSLVAPVTSGVLPQSLAANFDANAFAQNIEAEFAATTAALNAAAASAFTPSLDTLMLVVRSFSASSIMPGTPPPMATAPDVTLQPTPNSAGTIDPSFGGLGGVWTLVSFGAEGGEQRTPSEGVPITLEFGAQGAFGSDGCNSYRGNFSYENNTLTLSPLISTLRACPEPVMMVANEYTRALQNVTGFSIDGGTLTLTYVTDTESGTLTFTR